MIVCGSRFCTPAEQKYHPIEEELLAVTWALQKTSYYTLGCEHLLVLVDHKPLLGLLQSRNLGDIENPRLLHLAERLLRWKFSIQHNAGAQNFAPDALSRYPARQHQMANINEDSGKFAPERLLGQPELVTNINPGNSISSEDTFNSDQFEAQVLATSATRRLLVTSWDTVRTSGISDPNYSQLLHEIQSDNSTWPDTLSEYKRFRNDLTTVDGVVFFKGRVVIPKVLRQQTLQSLHLAHQGESSMQLRTQESVWWPNITKDIATTRATCTTCHKNAPTQQPLPPVQPPVPQYPFQLICSDYFHFEGQNYLVIADRYSNWPVLKKCKSDTAEELVTCLRDYFTTYGVPEPITSDGGSSYRAEATQQFLEKWGMAHRVSWAYNPHANLRSETAVKFMKRLIANNTGPSGSLNTNALSASLMSYRNTPDRDTQRSPAQILFARQIKDAIPVSKEKLKLRPEWVLTAEMREQALAKRHLSIHTELLSKSKQLKPLNVNDVVQVKNQRGNHAKKWDLSGKVMEVQPFDSYIIKMDGTGRLTKRNRRFLRPITPFSQPQIIYYPYSNTKIIYRGLMRTLITMFNSIIILIQVQQLTAGRQLHRCQTASIRLSSGQQL